MNNTRIAVAAFVATWMLAGAAAHGAAGDAAATCDLLAGSPIDVNRIGDGVAFDAIDFTAAEAPCRQAVAENPGVPRLQFELARVLQAKGDVAPAVATYETLAANGYAAAALALGRHYQSAEPAPDYAKAVVYFRKALDLGLDAAATDLAILEMNGLGVPADNAEAARLLTAPAGAGDSYAQYLLGYLNENGLGLPASLDRAIDLYRLSAAQGEGAAEYALGYLHDLGRGVTEDAGEALRLYRDAADDGYPFALVAIGDMYVDGRGVAKDPAEAERFYRKAIESDDSDAAPAGKNALAWKWAEEGVNLAEAEELASQAASEASEPEASYFDTLAWIRHKMGNNTEAVKDLERAIAINADFAPYHDRLGDIYAALGRPTDAHAEWQKALDLPAPAVAEEPTWSRDAVLLKAIASP